MLKVPLQVEGGRETGLFLRPDLQRGLTVVSRETSDNPRAHTPVLKQTSRDLKKRL